MLGLMAWLLATRASVWPSGAALATWSEPSMPAAPPLLSMFTGWLHAAVNLAPIRRAAKSIAPPGVAGTTIVSGLLGKFCAKARGTIAQANGAAISWRRYMKVFSPWRGHATAPLSSLGSGLRVG